MNRCSRGVEAFDLFKEFLPLASFSGAPYRLDETGVVKRVFIPPEESNWAARRTAGFKRPCNPIAV